jgi:hypothetical protein
LGNWIKTATRIRVPSVGFGTEECIIFVESLSIIFEEAVRNHFPSHQKKMNETLHDAVNRTFLESVYNFGVDMVNNPLRTLAANPVFVILTFLIPALPFILKSLFPEQKRVTRR